MRRVLLLLVLSCSAALIVTRVRRGATTGAASAAVTWPPITPRPKPRPGGGIVDDHADEIAADPSWKPVNADGTMPDGYPIKAKDQSMIFHVPTGRFYDRTKPERCYATEADAIADGYRRAKS